MGAAQRGAFDLVEFFHSDGSSGNTSVQGFTDNWTFFDVASHLDAGKSLSGIGVYGSGAGTYLDDFQIITTTASAPEPSFSVHWGLVGSA